MQLKKLDNRSRMLVHLGTKPGSKAYRLLDPQARKIVVSRDVVFDETKGWNWSQNNTEQGYDGSFIVTPREFGNHGIQNTEEYHMVLNIDHSESTKESSQDSNAGVNTSLCSNEYETENKDHPQTVLRRPERPSIKPNYLEDYVLFA